MGEEENIEIQMNMSIIQQVPKSDFENMVESEGSVGSALALLSEITKSMMKIDYASREDGTRVVDVSSFLYYDM